MYTRDVRTHSPMHRNVKPWLNSAVNDGVHKFYKIIIKSTISLQPYYCTIKAPYLNSWSSAKPLAMLQL